MQTFFVVMPCMWLQLLLASSLLAAVVCWTPSPVDSSVYDRGLVEEKLRFYSYQEALLWCYLMHMTVSILLRLKATRIIPPLPPYVLKGMSFCVHRALRRCPTYFHSFRKQLWSLLLSCISPAIHHQPADSMFSTMPCRPRSKAQWHVSDPQARNLPQPWPS